MVAYAKKKVKTAKAKALTSKSSTKLKATIAEDNVAIKVADVFDNQYYRFLSKYGVFASILLSVTVPQLLLLWRPVVGVYGDMAALALLLAIGVFNEKARKLAISTSILNVATMVTLCLPNTSIFIRTAVYNDFILLFAYIYRYLFTLDAPVSKPSELGKKYVVFLPLMIVIGEVLGVLGYFMLRHHYIYQYQGIKLSYVLGTAVVFAMAEEMMFRGLIQRLAGDIMNPGLAMLLAVTAYTFANIGSATILTAAFALIAGIVLSATYFFKQNLLLTTTTNALMKFTYVGLIATFVLK